MHIAEEEAGDAPSAVAPSLKPNEDLASADIAQNAEKFLDAVVKVWITAHATNGTA